MEASKMHSQWYDHDTIRQFINNADQCMRYIRLRPSFVIAHTTGDLLQNAI